MTQLFWSVINTLSNSIVAHATGILGVVVVGICLISLGWALWKLLSPREVYKLR